MRLDIKEKIILKKLVTVSSVPILVIIVVIIIYQLVWKAESDRRYRILDELGVYHDVGVDNTLEEGN